VRHRTRDLTRSGGAAPPDADPAAGEAAGAALAGAVKSRIGVTVAVQVVDPDGVERSMGKMRRIVDNRRP
jgi:phenylacetate-CoA ligase